MMWFQHVLFHLVLYIFVDGSVPPHFVPVRIVGRRSNADPSELCTQRSSWQIAFRNIDRPCPLASLTLHAFVLNGGGIVIWAGMTIIDKTLQVKLIVASWR